MTKLSAREVAGYAAAAGFTASEAIDATRIAYRESGWKTDATNGHDFGLWQINQVHDTAANRQRYGFTSKQDWFDPTLNAQLAYGLFQANGWNDWAAGPGGFTPVSQGGDPFYGTPKALQIADAIANGDDKSYGPGGIIPSPGDVVDGVKELPGAIGDAIGSVVPWASGLAKLLSVLTSADWWRRFGVGILGGLLLIAALVTAL